MSASAANTFLTTTSEPLLMLCCLSCNCMPGLFLHHKPAGSLQSTAALLPRGQECSQHCRPTAIPFCSRLLNPGLTAYHPFHLELSRLYPTNEVVAEDLTGHNCMLCASLITGPADHGCRKDLDFFASLTVEGHSDRDVKQRLQLVAESGFRRVSYTEAIEILQKALQDFKPSKKGEKLFPNTDVEVSLRCSELKGVFWQHIGCLSSNSGCHSVSFSPWSSDFVWAFGLRALLLAQQGVHRLPSLQPAQPGLLACR